MKKRILSILLSLIMAVGMLPTMAMAQETAPTFSLAKDLEGITIPENLVTCICTTTNESKTYGRLPNDFSASTVEKEGDVWTVIISVENSVYKEQFEKDTGSTHSPDLKMHSADFLNLIQFKLKYEGDKWVLDGAMRR